jgi:hypothetical protein
MLGDHDAIEIPRDLGLRQERVDAGREQQPARGVGIEQRMHAHLIAHGEQPVPRSVGDKQREAAGQRGEASNAVSGA